MASLGESYVKTLDLVAGDKLGEASGEFKKGFLQPVKKLYSEAAGTYPPRFSKVDDWCAWSKRLYLLTRKAENALRDGQTQQARDELSSLREHFYLLHVEAETQKSNDYIYAFLVKARAEQPDVAELNSIAAMVLNAEPCASTKADLDAYENARSTWSSTVSALLQDNRVEADELEPLRQATEQFYRNFGIQFE